MYRMITPDQRRLLRDSRPLYRLLILLLPFASMGYAGDWTAWQSIYDAAGGGIEYSIRPTNSVVDGDRMYYLRFRSRYDHPVKAEIVIYKRFANGTTSNGGSVEYTFDPAKGNIYQGLGDWHYAIEINPKVIRVFTDDETSKPLVGELKFPGKRSSEPSTAQEDPITKMVSPSATPSPRLNPGVLPPKTFPGKSKATPSLGGGFGTPNTGWLYTRQNGRKEWVFFNADGTAQAARLGESGWYDASGGETYHWRAEGSDIVWWKEGASGQWRIHVNGTKATGQNTDGTRDSFTFERMDQSPLSKP